MRNKICLWRPSLLTDQNEMSNLYRELSIDVSYQFPVHLAGVLDFVIMQDKHNIPILLLAHLAKGNVSFCHDLVSVVCRPLTFL
jgi:hypothetical protein